MFLSPLQKASLLDAEEYDQLASAEKRRYLQANIDLINRFLPEGHDLVLSDLAILGKVNVSSEDIASGNILPEEWTVQSFRGAYLLTEWFIVCLYLGNERRKRLQLQGDFLGVFLAIWLLVCYRAVRDTLAFCDTYPIFLRVVEELLQLGRGTKLDRQGIVEAVTRIRVDPAVQSEELVVIDDCVIQLLALRGIKRKHIHGARRLHFQASSAQQAIYDIINSFVDLYVVGKYNDSQNTDRLLKQKVERLIVMLPPGLLYKWMVDMLQTPLLPDETPFPYNEQRKKFILQPMWELPAKPDITPPKMAASEELSRRGDFNIMPVEPFRWPSEIGGAQNSILSNAQRQSLRQKEKATHPHPGPPPPLFKSNGASGDPNPVEPPSRLTKISLALAAAGALSIAAYYTRQRWGMPPTPQIVEMHGSNLLGE